MVLFTAALLIDWMVEHSAEDVHRLLDNVAL